MERIYGIEHGGNHGNQYIKAKPNNSVLISQTDIANKLGISVDSLQNYKKLTEMIPELEDLVETGILAPTTAIAIMRSLSEERNQKTIGSDVRWSYYI